MSPPVNQVPPAASSNVSESTATAAAASENRIERDPRKYERRSDLLCRVRYTNVLPDLPFDPKFLRYPFSQDRFVRYKPTSLEKNYRWELLTEHDVGVDIDLINPDAYSSSGQLTKEEERLLEDESASPADKKRSLLNQRSVPWLRKTEYISTEQSTSRTSARILETKPTSAKDKLREESMQDLTRDRIIQIIEEGFETAKEPLTKHYSKPTVHKSEEWPIFPDFDNWKYPFAQVIFDNDPYPQANFEEDQYNKDPSQLNQNHLEEMSEAVIKAFVDEENKEYIGYFLPTAETRAKFRRENQDEEEEETDDKLDFKLIREYTWNRKDKTMSGFEQSYFLVIKDEGAFYNELETRVRLSKRRVGAGKRMSKMKLLQTHREFNEAEEKNQRKRLKALDNEEGAEEASDEEEREQDGEGEEEEQEEVQDVEDNTREDDDENQEEDEEEPDGDEELNEN